MQSGYEGIDRRAGDRTEIRFAARISSGIRFSFDSAMSDDEDITSVIVSDLSQTGMATSGVEDVVAGSIVMLEVPLVGWRAAEVMWISGHRAGCRFLASLTQDELRVAVTSSPLISEAFPGFAAQMETSRYKAGLSVEAIAVGGTVSVPFAVSSVPELSMSMAFSQTCIGI